MKINLKTAGSLGRYLPAGANGNLAEVEVAEGATPLDVMRQLGFPEEASYLVVLNGSSLPKAERDQVKLAEDDKLAIMPPLKGG